MPGGERAPPPQAACFAQPMPTNRLEAFSDGVIAVAITLLALDLPIPDAAGTHDLAGTLGRHWPNFAAFAISFVTIGIIWINHHAMLHRIARVDHALLMLNMLLLLSVCLLPFSTALMSNYLTAGHGQHLAAAIYGGSLLLMAVLFFTAQDHVVHRRPELLQAGVTEEIRRVVRRRNAAGLLPYVIATAAATLTPYLTFAIAGAVDAYYAIPNTNADVTSEAAEQED